MSGRIFPNSPFFGFGARLRPVNDGWRADSLREGRTRRGRGHGEKRMRLESVCGDERGDLFVVRLAMPSGALPSGTGWELAAADACGDSEGRVEWIVAVGGAREARGACLQRRRAGGRTKVLLGAQWFERAAICRRPMRLFGACCV